MITILRVQDSEGRGPWRPGFSHRWVESRDDHENLLSGVLQFPTAHRRLYSWENSGYGCQSADVLRRWFTKTEYQKLLSFGYQAVEMQVDRLVDRSDIQCVFARIKPLSEDVKPFDLY